jgi:hypothetical protein
MERRTFPPMHSSYNREKMKVALSPTRDAMMQLLVAWTAFQRMGLVLLARNLLAAVGLLGPRHVDVLKPLIGTT